MSRRLPEFVEPLRLAGLGRSVKGRLPVDRLRRLGKSLHGTDGEVNVELDFGSDAQGRPQLLGRISARLEVLCQRCLTVMALPVEANVCLYLAAAEAEEVDTPEGGETLVVGDQPMRLADIVEDELILGLPLVPMHDEDTCKVPRNYATGGDEKGLEGHHPFALLAAWKKNRLE